MNRHHDWQARLTDYVTPLMAHADFVPGRLDCALFADGAVEAMTGTSLAADFRGYRTLSGGYRKLRKAGLEDHVALVAAHLREVPPAMAHQGDVAVVGTDDGPALGIVQGEMVYCMRPAGGIGLVPLLMADRAFHVPFDGEPE